MTLLALLAALLACCLTSASALSFDYLVMNPFYEEEMFQHQLQQMHGRRRRWDHMTTWLDQLQQMHSNPRHHPRYHTWDMLDLLQTPTPFPQEQDLEVRELSDHYEVELELPGMQRGDVTIKLQGDQLYIQAERKASCQQQPTEAAVTAGQGEVKVEGGGGALAEGLEITEEGEGGGAVTQEHLPVATAVSPTCNQKDSSAWSRRKSIRHSFTLGRDVDGGQVKAELRNGLLLLRLPKRKVAPPLDINIEVM
jgi:HSP20 family molecular chaperone IbpA